MLRILLTSLILGLTAFISSAQDSAQFEALGRKLDSIRIAENVPAAQIAIVHKDSLVRTYNLGISHIDTEKPVTDSTMFRIGSVTKSFTALAVMLLVEDGKLSLDDKVRDLAPELPFENAWEETDPISLAHLLEHTTGFDDMRLVEYVKNGAEMNTLEGMQFYPDSKVSRWRPGTHMSYCNSGPPMAAYIVEKISGKTIEDFIGERLFDPLGMNHSSFFLDEYVEKHLAGGYLGPKNKPTDYWHFIGRASGSINSTATEMSSYIRLFLNKGQVNDSLKLISEESLYRIERPQTTLAAKAGEELGYGLNIRCMDYKGTRVCGHNGGMEGFLTNMRYIPSKDMGFIIFVNKREGIYPLVEAVLDFVIDPEDQWKIPSTSTEGLNPNFLGYYRTASSRNSFARFMEWYLNIAWIEEQGDSLFFNSLTGEKEVLSVVNKQKLIQYSRYGAAMPMILTKDLDGNTILQESIYGRNYYKTRAWVVWGFGILSLAAILVLLSFFIYPLFLGIRYLFSNNRIFPSAYTLPFLTSFFYLLTMIAFIIGFTDPDVINSLGKPNPITICIFLGSVLFGLFGLISIYQAIRKLNSPLSVSIRVYLVLGAISFALVIVYYTYFQILGIRTWA
ncbi:MAG: serine hydrolase domain-containing protein [Bacteroidota bacterium]